ncbi:hypothetical protein ASPZODRAFT_150610 [Penicilliopsis zonata CBS 506.65]|uniref:Uncharacterized protein n=1 Tax=Penicilliopsis zonata CBS 506.65 TaxID=1073090 RepID=A0A1L9SMV3_9EURO|nr:hypothetical protein ASPZODRAFT_150610 [Penicilliopsis zonata CBS 506.65]OJJ48367.1 hypothetical protein ASPZODRAFT_150610 [Penicilliopsis zonata CBS 506.65]
MTATLNGTYNPAPDTPSPVYPDRLIRPLPKRTLRSRLSLDAADSILYPPAPPAPPAAQLFYGSCADHADVVNDSKVYVQQNGDVDGDDASEREQQQQHHHHHHHNHPYENGVDFESGEEDGPVVVRRSVCFRGASLSPSASGTHPAGYQSDADGAQMKSPSGPDGYDAFENTNNKKKRKIPMPGNLGSHHSNLSPEFATMGLSGSAPAPTPQKNNANNDGNNTTGTYYGTGNPASPVGIGMSGPGRGRLGGRNPTRNGSVRNPLSVHTANTWITSRAQTRRDLFLSSPGAVGDSSGKTDQGIISAAIANAAAFSSPLKGPGNISLLDQQTKTPTKTQFTFTCESDSSKGMAMQPQHPPFPLSQQHRSPTSPSAAAHAQRGFATQGTQTSPSIAHMNQQMHQQGAPSAPPQAPSQANESGTAEKKKKKKRSPRSIYALAARQRKIQQQYANLHHPPSMEDIWICEFCEYESIFGHPPEALIRQYEIKDRKERKRLAEKRRLLEKAKMKGRKGKKTSKNATKNATPQQASHQHGYDRASVDHSSMDPHSLHDDDYLAHDYDDEPHSAPAPPHPPAAAAAAAAAASFTLPLPPGMPSHGEHPSRSMKGVMDGGTTRPA